MMTGYISLKGCILLILVGILFAAIGFVIGSQQDALYATQVESTRGTIIDVRAETKRDSDDNSYTEYTYIIQYSAADNSYTITETTRKKLENGSAVTIAYNPDSPSSARCTELDGLSYGVFGWIGVGIAGLGVLLTAWAIVLKIKGNKGSIQVTE